MVHLVNTIPTLFFKITRGLRQGFPLSHILYILIAKALRRGLDKEILRKTIPCIKIVQGAKRTKNSEFTNDIILFGAASSIITNRFKKVMYDYTTTS
jgi:hypothetical protein